MYSVWDQGKGVFEYFEDAKTQDTLNTPAPSHLGNRPLGTTVAQAGWPLPATARITGSGPVAIGRIASKPGAAALGDDLLDRPMVKAGALLGAAILLYKYVVKGRRK